MSAYQDLTNYYIKQWVERNTYVDKVTYFSKFLKHSIKENFNINDEVLFYVRKDNNQRCEAEESLFYDKDRRMLGFRLLLILNNNSFPTANLFFEIFIRYHVDADTQEESYHVFFNDSDQQYDFSKEMHHNREVAAEFCNELYDDLASKIEYRTTSGLKPPKETSIGFKMNSQPLVSRDALPEQ